MITSPSHADLDAQWRSRVRGALQLATWADALGATPEARVVRPGDDPPVWVSAARLGGRMRSMWLLAEHLARHGGEVVPAELGRMLVGEPAPARTQVPELASQVRLWTGTSLAGHGLLGRAGAPSTVPVGLVPGIGLATVAQRARQAVALTQPHPLVLDVATVQAVAVAVVARETDQSLHAEAVVTRITSQVRTPALLPVLRRVPAMIRHATNPRQVAMQLPGQPGAASAVPIALTAFLLHSSDPLAAIRFAMAAGGDARAAAAMTGALCGAHHGEQALPEPVEFPPHLTRVADSLARLRAAD